MFDSKIPTFDDFTPESKSSESDNKTESMKNYKNYLAGKEPLKHAIFTHREGDGMHDYVRGSMNNKFSSLNKNYWKMGR